MIKSQAIRYKDFSSQWYKKWSKVLQQEDGVYGRSVHNKAWQNAVILQALYERGYIKQGKRALGFGVGTERVPSALAALGVTVTATDQDFQSGQKAGWDNIGQLTREREDLNQYGIATPQMFNDNVTFENCDMNHIGNSFDAQYDIVWSNCALGHLGSIQHGLDFIEGSLDALKPGGIAVHTTEVQIIPDAVALDSGDTVVFRKDDIAALFLKLRSAGYGCAPLYLDFGSQPEDQVVAAHPYTDEPLLKLNVGGYPLSQMVLIIKKPRQLRPSKTAGLKARVENKLNRNLIASYLTTNESLKHYMSHQEPTEVNRIQPAKSSSTLKAKPGQTVSTTVQLTNTSDNTYYDVFSKYHNGRPLVIATDQPINRPSSLATDSWASSSRPVLKLQTSRANSLDGIRPDDAFTADITLQSPKKPGTYTENFCMVVEGSAVIEQSAFTIKLIVAK